MQISRAEESYTNISWYITFAVSIVVLIFCDLNFNYNVEYMSSSTQIRSTNSFASFVLLFYLIVDFWFNNENTCATHLHHIESAIGIMISIYGKNVGVVNNCFLNEASTIWLCLIVIFNKHGFKQIGDALLIPFTLTFVTHRIFPLSVMLVIMVQNIDRFAYDEVTMVHFALFLVHTGLQYHWFALIVKKAYKKAFRKTRLQVI